MREDSVLALFAKYPEPGHVKTRLAARIGDEAAARAYDRMLRKLIAEHSDRDYSLVAFVTPPSKVALFAREYGVSCRPQRGKGLGERMEGCFHSLLGEYDRVAIAGSDVPELSSDRVAQAFAKTDRSDVVLGPCPDGGYYLIASRWVPPVFTNIPWSTDQVLSRTLDRLRACDKSWSLLPEERDIDEPEDLNGFGPTISVIVPVVDGDRAPSGVRGTFDECIVVRGIQGPHGRLHREGGLEIRTRRGRAHQMNAGAAEADGDVLLFLHADTRLPPDAAMRVRRAIVGGAPGGCFQTAFDDRHPIFKFADLWRNVRTRLTGAFYGDQTIFTRILHVTLFYGTGFALKRGVELE